MEVLPPVKGPPGSQIKKSKIITQAYFGATSSNSALKNLRSQSSSNLNRLSHLRSKMQLDSTSKEEDLSIMDGEKSLSKMEFHQILERYKAKAMVGAGGKPTELTLIPENVSARLDTSAH